MKQYDLKRAVITLIETGDYKSERDLQRRIKMYKDALKALGPVNRDESQDFRRWKYEIGKLRNKARDLRNSKMTFKVFVKKYRKEQIVDWDFPGQELGPHYGVAFKEMIKGVVDKAIQKCRLHSQHIPHSQPFAGYMSEFVGDQKKGRVFSKDGEVLRIYVEKNLKSLYNEKKPVEPRKYIGIELEFCAPIRENQFAVRLFKSGIHKFAQLKKDGSLRPHDNETGYELAILLEESNYKKRLKQITTLLADVGAVVEGRRAGLHVHIDMRRRNKDLVYNNLVSCQYALLSIVDPKRYNNEFCRVVESNKFPTEFTGNREERYKTINAAAFYKYKTLEVRMHEGSVDFAQISNWVDLLVRIANYSKKMKNDVSKVAVLGKRLSLDKKLLGYIQDRSCFWQVQNTGESRNLRVHLDEINRLHQRMSDQALGGIPYPTPAPTSSPTSSPDDMYRTATRSLFDTYTAGISSGVTLGLNNVTSPSSSATLNLELDPGYVDFGDLPEEE